MLKKHEALWGVGSPAWLCICFHFKTNIFGTFILSFLYKHCHVKLLTCFSYSIIQIGCHQLKNAYERRKRCVGVLCSSSCATSSISNKLKTRFVTSPKTSRDNEKNTHVCLMFYMAIKGTFWSLLAVLLMSLKSCNSSLRHMQISHLDPVKSSNRQTRGNRETSARVRTAQFWEPIYPVSITCQWNQGCYRSPSSWFSIEFARFTTSFSFLLTVHFDWLTLDSSLCTLLSDLLFSFGTNQLLSKSGSLSTNWLMH